VRVLAWRVHKPRRRAPPPGHRYPEARHRSLRAGGGELHRLAWR
jgi:hypothetical protein